MSSRLRLLAITVTAISLSVSMPAPSATGPSFLDQLRVARVLLTNNDLTGARQALRRLDEAAGGLPSAAWPLAWIASRLGERDEALTRLEDYAAMGLARSPRADSAFAPLRGMPRFEAVAKQLEANAAPLGHAIRVFSLDDPSLLAEDLAYDPKRRTLYVSSIHRRKVIALDARGVARDFVTSAQDGVWGIYGLALDTARGRLWGSSAAGPTIEGYDVADTGRTAIACWDLETGRRRMWLELPRDGGRHVLGDLAIGPDGVVYVTDSIGGGLYRVRFGAASFDTVAPPASFGSPQMPVVMEGGKRLIVADYSRGLVSVDLASGTLTSVPKPRTLAASGIDGLYRAGRGLIAIQNGTRPIRVLWLSLDREAKRITDWKVLEQASPALGEPNHGVIVGNAFWLIGNSGWDRVNAREELETSADAQPAVILRLDLPGR